MPKAYTKRFYGGPVAYPRVALTVPGGLRWVVVDVEWYTQATVAAECWCSVAGVPFADRVLNASTGTRSAQWQGRVAVNAGEQLLVQNASGQTVYGLVTGYELTA